MTIINRHHSHDHLLFTLLALWLLIAFLWVAHSPALAQTINDGEITLAIDRLLMSDQGVSAHALDVQTSDGIVTVSGVVSHLLARERAAQIAATVKGVRAVVNLIEVSPKMFPDSVLRSEIAQALADDPATDLLNIEVTVNNATAMLSGKADSWSQEQLCLAVAKGVRGVKTVTSKMEVSQQTKRPDQEIEAEIERRLFFDVWIDESLITVKVKLGRVELGGAVASLAEKQRAFTKAWVAGVAAVEDKDLVVDWSLLDEMRRSPVAPPSQSDIQTEQALKDAFKDDPRLSSLDLDVSFEAGVATLRGLVSSLQARKAAEADARNTRGVWQVRNHLKVRPEMAPTTRPKPDFNAKLAEKVRLSLLRNPYTHQHKIGVTVNDHMVILDGTVSSTVEKVAAEEAAATIRGVVAVINNIEVMGPWMHKDDWEIEQQVNEALWWSPYVDDDLVSVTVTDGVITLVGVVDSLRARRTATANAYQAGAKKVRNLLKVRYGPVPLRP